MFLLSDEDEEPAQKPNDRILLYLYTPDLVALRTHSRRPASIPVRSIIPSTCRAASCASETRTTM
ncbi:MAG: hypothetical protein KY459_11790 [Acidobacteria bacterium]|nr:hypothetical protein [Acidobacteriota bacterium]